MKERGHSETWLHNIAQKHMEPALRESLRHWTLVKFSSSFHFSQPSVLSRWIPNFLQWRRHDLSLHAPLWFCTVPHPPPSSHNPASPSLFDIFQKDFIVAAPRALAPWCILFCLHSVSWKNLEVIVVLLINWRWKEKCVRNNTRCGYAWGSPPVTLPLPSGLTGKWHFSAYFPVAADL